MPRRGPKAGSLVNILICQKFIWILLSLREMKSVLPFEHAHYSIFWGMLLPV
jgi:hypothetical protein